jgi:hypothetical protein
MPMSGTTQSSTSLHIHLDNQFDVDPSRFTRLAHLLATPSTDTWQATLAVSS